MRISIRKSSVFENYLNLRETTNGGSLRGKLDLDYFKAKKEVDYLLKYGRDLSTWDEQGEWIAEALELEKVFYNHAGKLGHLVVSFLTPEKDGLTPFEKGYSITGTAHGPMGKPAEKSKEPRDAQKSKVYRWEQSRWGDLSGLSEKECQDTVNRMYRWFLTGSQTGKTRKAPPRIIFNSKGSSSWASWSGITIKLHRDMMNTNVIAHEVAHTVTGNTEEDGAHGRQFVRHFMDLMVKFKNMDIRELESSAKTFKVKVAPRTQSERVKRGNR